MYRLRIKLPAEFSNDKIVTLGYALEDYACAYVAMREDNHHQGSWTLEWIFNKKPDLEDFAQSLFVCSQALDIDIVSENLEWNLEDISDDINWLEECYRQFPPFSVGPFFVYGSHYQEGVPGAQIGLHIDAATAFGSGEHGTTKGCLQAMLELKARGVCPWNVLDMGTGSGILAIAAWKLWKTPILAVDNDEECVRVTRHHCEVNGVALAQSAMSCEYSDGFSSDIVQKKSPYELIIANILAGPLMEMATDLADVVDDNGYVILSGILNELADSVTERFEAKGLSFVKRYEVEDWSTIVLHNARA